MSITGTNTELIKRNLNYRAEKYQQIRGVVGKGSKLGVYGYSPIGIGVEGESGDGEGVLGQSYSSSGVIGKSHFGVGVSGSSGLYTGVLGTGSLGVWGSSYDSIGVLGESRDYVGVVGKGQIAGVWSKGKLKVDNVPSAPNQERFLVWDADNYVKYRTMEPSGGSFNGTLDDKPLILKDASGDTVFSVMTDGKSVHKGEETFLDGIKLTDANNGPGMFILQRSIILFDKNGGAGGTLDGDRGLISFKPVEVRDTLRVKDAQGNVVTMFAPDGTSLHKGDETFEGDVILKGKGIKLVDGNGTTLGGFGRTDLDTGQRLGVYGKAEQSGDLAGAFDGNVDVRGEITTNSLHIVDANGDTLTSFNNDGTSIHTGLETYKAGIKTTLNNGNILRIDPAEGLTIKTPSGQFIAHIRYDGAAYFAGNVSKGGGSFKIDHPLDPEHKFLYHSFVESPDMMNVYNGNVTLNNSGEALVKLPDWFEALNKDFKYQLTAIGAPGPNLYIAEKVSGNRFKIAGGTEGMEVSWQITGIRKDAYAEKHRIPVEELKKGDEIGHYLHPDAFGLPENMGITTSGESSRLTNNDLNKR